MQNIRNIDTACPQGEQNLTLETLLSSYEEVIHHSEKVVQLNQSLRHENALLNGKIARLELAIDRLQNDRDVTAQDVIGRALYQLRSAMELNEGETLVHVLEKSGRQAA